jgi:hypothetical protein
MQAQSTTYSWSRASLYCYSVFEKINFN